MTYFIGISLFRTCIIIRINDFCILGHFKVGGISKQIKEKGTWIFVQFVISLIIILTKFRSFLEYFPP